MPQNIAKKEETIKEPIKEPIKKPIKKEPILEVKAPIINDVKIKKEDLPKDSEIIKQEWFFWKLFWKKEEKINNNVESRSVRNFESVIKILVWLINDWKFEQAKKWLNEIKG